MDHRKIAVGIPTYSHTYKLLWSFWHTDYAPATGVSQYGGDTSFSTVLLFNWDIWELLEGMPTVETRLHKSVGP